jgi:tRNA nucleotidyltransferase (CCA-adding enzyme)
VPNDYRDLAVLVTKYHLYPHLAKELRPETKLKLFESLDAFRRPERFELFLLACEADSRGRPGYEDRLLEKPDILRRALAAAQAVDAAALAQQGLKGEAIASELRRQRIAAIANSH